MEVSVLKLVIFCFISLISNNFMVVEGANWCVARSDASNQALQTALDYACGSGADCNPILSNGLCFLPNTIQAHASYAFNSYYQRKAMAPGSCDFSGAATIAQTNPSYGSCMYPSSLSTAGGATPTTPATVTNNNPNVPLTPTSTTSINGDGSTGLNNPGLTPPLPTTNDSKGSLVYITSTLMLVMPLLVLSVMLHPMWIF